MNTKYYKFLLVAFAAMGFPDMVHATPLAIYDFTGQPGNQVSTPRTGGSGDVNFSDITRGAGITAAMGTNSMNSAGWTTSPFPDLTDYYEVSILGVRPGYGLWLERVFFRYNDGATGPTQMVVRSNRDGYTNDIGTAVLNRGATEDMEIAFTYPLDGPCTLRFYAFSSTGGALRLQNHSVMGGMVFDGTIFSPQPLTVQWSNSSQIVAENCGIIWVTASASTYSIGDVTVPFTVTGTASNSVDYTITTGSITIPAGYLNGSIGITVADDALAENSETVILTMGNPYPGTLGAPTVHTATIADNDGLVQWTAASQSGAESAGTMTVTAQLSAACGLPVTVPFTVTGTAYIPADFSISGYSITIPAGSLTGSATITVFNDTLYENNETVVLTMGTPTNAKLGAVTVHAATIIDNDPPSLVVSPSTLAVNEGNLGGFAVRLSAAPFADTIITTVFADGDTDLSVIVGGSLTFTTANWNNQQFVNIAAAEDPDALNGQATFTVSSPGLTSQTVTVTENDNEKLFADWALLAGLTANQALPEAMPYGEGVNNLLKYAFNLDATRTDAHTLVPSTGTSGLPSLTFDHSGAQPVMRIEYLRRRNSGLIYTPLKSKDLSHWFPLTTSPTVSVLSTEWERVIVSEPCDNAIPQMSFGRVLVKLP